MADTQRALLSASDQVYVEKARMAARRISSPQASPEDLRQVAQAVREVAGFDVEVPTASQRREWELVKVGVKRLSVWYMRYLAQQLNEFGARVARMGDALALRTERLERGSEELEARIGAAEERLARLEALALGPAASGPARAANGSAPSGPVPPPGPPAKTAPVQRRPAGTNRGAPNRPRNSRRKGSGA